MVSSNHVPGLRATTTATTAGAIVVGSVGASGPAVAFSKSLHGSRGLQRLRDHPTGLFRPCTVLANDVTSACNSLQGLDRPPYPDPAHLDPEGAPVARLQLDDVTNIAKDAAYVSVGLGVIAFQRL